MKYIDPFAEHPAILPAEHDLLCFSHLRWDLDLVVSRPRHLLGRFARERRVFYLEEPLFHDGAPHITVSPRGDNLWVVVPHLPAGLSQAAVDATLRGLVDRLCAAEAIDRPILWFYTPAAIGHADHIEAAAIIYDRMHELCGYPALAAREQALLARADLVFTGGESLYEVTRHRHPRVCVFPDGIDRARFARARDGLPDPADQAGIPRPRLGHAGVIDGCLDLDLVAGIADLRPDWQLVMIGPVVDIDPSSLPRRPNIHWIGPRDHDELPDYIAGWDVAILPYVRNAATRCINPARTPEYLAAGKPVVSTSLRDVVRAYGDSGLVAIADTPALFVAAALRELGRCDHHWLARVDLHLAGCAWDETWRRMHTLVARTVAARPPARTAVDPPSFPAVQPWTPSTAAIGA